MTHAPETGTTNRIYFSSADFWYMCRANLGPDSSGTRFRRRLEQCSIPSQKVAEMMTCDWSMIIVDVLRFREVVLCSAAICLFT